MMLPQIKVEFERWKYNKELEIYVSTLGRFKDKNKTIIKPKINKSGYFTLSVKGKKLLAHRIVLFTYKPTFFVSDLTVDHLDSNKRNNKLKNLEWVFKQENLRRAEENLFKEEMNPPVKINDKKKIKGFLTKNNELVTFLKYDTKNVDKIRSYFSKGDKKKINQALVVDLVRGNKTFLGCRWGYKDELLKIKKEVGNGMNYDCTERFNEHVEEGKTLVQEEKIIGTFLQGSQNYDLDIEQSDVDTKMLVVPSLEEIVLNKKPKSYTHVRENDEHIDVKDIRLMFDCFKKQNINFLEILFADCYNVNELYAPIFKDLILIREELAWFNPYRAVSCIKGMSLEKINALQKPYPSKAEVLEKYGYDPKQLHHIIRLYYFLQGYIEGVEYKKLLKSEKHNRIILDAKMGVFKEEEALALANTYNKLTVDMADDFRANIENKNNAELELYLNELLTRFIKTSLVKELVIY